MRTGNGRRRSGKVEERGAEWRRRRRVEAGGAGRGAEGRRRMKRRIRWMRSWRRMIRRWMRIGRRLKRGRNGRTRRGRNWKSWKARGRRLWKEAKEAAAVAPRMSKGGAASTSERRPLVLGVKKPVVELRRAIPSAGAAYVP